MINLLLVNIAVDNKNQQNLLLFYQSVLFFGKNPALCFNKSAVIVAIVDKHIVL